MDAILQLPNVESRKCVKHSQETFVHLLIIAISNSDLDTSIFSTVYSNIKVAKST